MDPKLFLQRLSEVAEWHRPRLGPNGQPALRKGFQLKTVPHPGEITPEELESMTEQQAQDYYEQLCAWRETQPNESIPPEILRIKPQALRCEDCHRWCPEGRRVERKLHQTQYAHWREFCTTCEMYRDPQTGEFTLAKLKSHQRFNDYHRPRLNKRKSQREPQSAQTLTKTEIARRIAAEGVWHTEETEHSVIRRFEQKK